MSSKHDLRFEQDDCVPSYEESIAVQPPAFDQKATSRPSLQQHLSQTRARRILEVITTYLEPLLASHGLDGVQKRAFVLLPSDVLTEQNLSERNLVISPAVPVSLIRLHGDENRASFWQQPTVVTEFTAALRTHLITDVQQSDRPHFSPQASTPVTALPPRPCKQSWLKRTFGLPGPEHDPTGSTGQWRLGWRAEDDAAATARSLGADELDATAWLKDVSFRTETEMGLLATETMKCIWIEIEVGS